MYEKKNQILDATYALFYEGRMTELSSETIAEKANLTSSEVLKEFESLDEITRKLAARTVSRLKSEAKNLAKEKGIIPLQKLISNDLELFYRVEMDKELLTPDLMPNHTNALAILGNYFEHDMPNHYEEFLENNPELLPRTDFSVSYFAQFVCHSIQFFNYETLKQFEATSKGRKEVTEQIIASLFGKDNITLKTF